MIPTLVLLGLCALPQDALPAGQARSRPSSRPVKRMVPDRERTRPADWGQDAPGRAVMSIKFLPIQNAPYTTAEKVADRVGDEDLVIGLLVGGRAFAYPINMLGGPQREIINEEFSGVPFCVNW